MSPVQQMKRRYAFLNSGRAKSAAQVIEALDKVERPRRHVYLNEIGEGDKGYDDMRLVREALSDTHQITHADSKEPIAVPKDRKVKSTKQYGKGVLVGVKHQSPNRHIVETIIENDGDLPDEVLLGGHFYAGAMNGSRKRAIKVLLRSLYWLMFRLMKRTIRKHHRAGRHVSWFMDTNWRGFPKMHPDEVRPYGAAPDYSGLIPAPGWEVRDIEHQALDQPVEKGHDVHLVNATFVKVGADH